MAGFAWAGLILLAALVWLAVRALAAQPRSSDLWRPETLATRDTRAFCLDYVRRSMAFRRTAALVAIVLGAIWSLRWPGNLMLWGMSDYSATDCPTPTQCVSSTSASLAGTLVYAGVLGVIIGALLAESYHLRPGRGPRQASLDARPPQPLPGLAHASWLVTAIAVTLAVADWMEAGTASLPLSLVPGLLAVGLAQAVQRAVADRRRPVLGAQAMLVDRTLRQVAAASAVWTQLAAATLCLGWAAMGVGLGLPDSANPAWLGVARFVLVYGGFLTIVPALVCLDRSTLGRVRRLASVEPARAAA